MRIAILTRDYPSDGDLYKYPFVHRRVLAYVAGGHKVHVLKLAPKSGCHTFDGIKCRSVEAGQFADAVTAVSPDVIAIHGFDERMWAAVSALNGRWPICAWLHGSEIPAFYREKAKRLPDDEERRDALKSVIRRAEFWRSILSFWPKALNLAFVSRSSVDLMRQDLAFRWPESPKAVVIHNPIDTDLFTYCPKTAGDRYNVLSIRPYDSSTYGNDLAVSAVLALRSHPEFERIRFSFLGDGPMFDAVLAPLQGFANVSIQRRFLRQEQIAAKHKENGIFLVPSRLDTQGVSRDEAMASGLVPVTNAVHAIPEFVDDSCAGLADRDDVKGLASQIAAMVDHPALFLSRSAKAAARVRAQTAHDLVIRQELEWMERCSRATP